MVSCLDICYDMRCYVLVRSPSSWSKAVPENGDQLPGPYQDEPGFNLRLYVMCVCVCVCCQDVPAIQQTNHIWYHIWTSPAGLGCPKGLLLKLQLSQLPNWLTALLLHVKPESKGLESVFVLRQYVTKARKLKIKPESGSWIGLRWNTWFHVYFNVLPWSSFMVLISMGLAVWALACATTCKIEPATAQETCVSAKGKKKHKARAICTMFLSLLYKTVHGS